jgi:catechol 2,3-dioxygenase-like lactoylglutathione lyase family enzyme
MFDHVTIYVPDRDASERFFETVLIPLGIETTYRTNNFAEWDDFSLTYAAEDEHLVTSGLHVAFAAPSREQVDAFWQAGIDAGFADDGPPGPRPQYLEDYYGSFLRSPDGNSVEAVHYGDVGARTGLIDHVWIRVADLAASTAFYRLVAEAAGLTIHEHAERTSLEGPDGGSLSLVAGGPTQNVHMAFPGDNAAVDRFHASLTSAGYPDNGEPRERPQYHPGYYAAYVLDPDGNNIEVVNHNRR